MEMYVVQEKMEIAGLTDRHLPPAPPSSPSQSQPIRLWINYCCVPESPYWFVSLTCGCGERQGGSHPRPRHAV
jgi:hypothetical protein